MDVWIFVRTDCPISNRSAPAIAKLQQDFASRGVSFLLVYPEPGATQQSIDRHKKEYGLQAIPAVLDPDLQRVRKATVSVTPETALFSDSGKLIYRGRIDDRQATLRIAKAPQKQDLRDALLLPPTRVIFTKAMGCAIEGLR